MRDALAVRATHIIVAFDGDKVFRYKLYPAYKANRTGAGKGIVISDEDRDGADEAHDIYQYYPRLFEALAALGIPFYQPTKREADDCLCSCAVKYPAHGYNVVCGTQDKDSFQYLRKGVRLYDSSYKVNGESVPRYITHKDVIEMKGVKPSQMVEYQMLIGDAGDNIDGLPGIGPKTAAARLKEFGSIKKWYESGTKKERSLLRTNQAKLIRNRKLVTLVEDCPPPFELDQAVIPKKVKVRFDIPKSYYNYLAFLYPKSKGLAGLLRK
jgi:DNA polymerase-1